MSVPGAQSLSLQIPALPHTLQLPRPGRHRLQAGLPLQQLLHHTQLGPTYPGSIRENCPGISLKIICRTLISAVMTFTKPCYSTNYRKLQRKEKNLKNPDRTQKTLICIEMKGVMFILYSLLMETCKLGVLFKGAFSSYFHLMEINV